MKKKGFTLIELLVVVGIIALLLAILMPAMSRVRKIAQRVVCGTRLKGLGASLVVYASDTNDSYPVGGANYTHTWGIATNGWQVPTPAWSNRPNITVAASLYLLVREADVGPKSFVCPAGSQTEFDGKNDGGHELMQLWDFGGARTVAPNTRPGRHVSYAYHMPYAADGKKGRYAPDANKNGAFAIMADKNPFFDNKLSKTSLAYDAITNANFSNFVKLMYHYNVASPLYKASDPQVKIANSSLHDRTGQNVLFADGSARFERVSNCGVRYDNIYTTQNFGQADNSAIEQGVEPTPNTGVPWPDGSINQVTPAGTFGTPYQPFNTDDSFLVNDDIPNA